MKFPNLPADEPAEEAVEFHSEDVDFTPSHPEALRAWLLGVAGDEQIPLREIHYIFCSDDYLLALNQEHLGHDYYTDVITFPYADEALYGDIFISVDRVADNARGLGVPFDDELHRVMVHGLLHLAGFRDETDAEEADMRARENYHLERRPPSTVHRPPSPA